MNSPAFDALEIVKALHVRGCPVQRDREAQDWCVHCNRVINGWRPDGHAADCVWLRIEAVTAQLASANVTDFAAQAQHLRDTRPCAVMTHRVPDVTSSEEWDASSPTRKSALLDQLQADIINAAMDSASKV